MHQRYAAILGIENLELNQHYRPNNFTSAPIQSTEPLTLNKQLFTDIKLSAQPMVINSVYKGSEMKLTDDKLTLPTEQLSANDKRALWALMSKHLDKL
ncbi:hypothetical protein V6237_03645 [Pseudoalteromonas carrageenovora]|uniref:hypothetical protein n=1 Tax=Pseudoalteromonas carrageenovora TaxID=227 RepID=UPI00311EBEF9